MNENEWFAITPRGDTGVDPERSWYSELHRQRFCTQCGEQRPEFAGQPIDIFTAFKPPNMPLISMGKLPARIAKHTFLDMFKDAAEEYLVQGNVFGPDGDEDHDFVSYTAPYALPIRGGAESIRKTCGTCGRFGYYPMPFDYRYRYILSTSLPPGRSLYMSELCELVLRGDLLTRIDLKTRKQFRIRRLPVKDKAEDGIEDFPILYL